MGCWHSYSYNDRPVLQYGIHYKRLYAAYRQSQRSMHKGWRKAANDMMMPRVESYKKAFMLA